MKLTEEKIIHILETVFKQKVGTIDRSTPLETIARDSMDVIELIAILKNTHQITINPSEISNLQTVGDVTDYVLSHL